MYDLYFLENKDFDGTEKFIGTFKTEEKALDNISNFFKKQGIDIDYFNMWTRPNTDTTIIDYGSYTHYYALVKK